MARLAQLPTDTVLVSALERSGSTWLGQVFNSHPDTLYLRESAQFLEAERRSNAARRVPAECARRILECTTGSYLRRALTRRSARAVGHAPLFTKSYLTALDYAKLAVLKCGVRLAECAGVPGITEFELTPSITGDERVVWHSLNAIDRLDTVDRALAPRAIVVLICHPCTYVESILRATSRGELPASHPLSEDYRLFAQLLSDPLVEPGSFDIENLRALTPAERLAWRWALINGKALRAMNTCDNAIVVRAEDLHADPVGSARALFRHASLDWNVQTAKFAKRPLAAPSERRRLSTRARARILDIVRETAPGELYASEFPPPSSARLQLENVQVPSLEAALA